MPEEQQSAIVAADAEIAAAVDAPETPPPARAHNPIRLGILLRGLAVICFGGMGALVKIASNANIPIVESIFFRSAFAFVPIGGVMLWRYKMLFPTTRHPKAHIRRIGSGLLALVCGFIALSMLPFATAVAIGFTTPLFITLLSGPLLGERVGLDRWLITIAGFTGVAIMLNPSLSDMHNLGALVALAGAFSGAFAIISIRRLAHEPAIVTAFFFMLATTCASALLLPFYWVTPPPDILAVLISIGLLGGVGQLLITQSLRLAPPALIVPIDYTQMIWASLLGYLLWHEVLTPRAWLGGAVIILAGCCIVLSEFGWTRIFRVLTRALRRA